MSLAGYDAYKLATPPEYERERFTLLPKRVSRIYLDGSGRYVRWDYAEPPCTAVRCVASCTSKAALDAAHRLLSGEAARR